MLNLIVKSYFSHSFYCCSHFKKEAKQATQRRNDKNETREKQDSLGELEWGRRASIYKWSFGPLEVSTVGVLCQNPPKMD